jgi:hypothetical protein
MKLTDGEKLILYMLSEIYEHLGIEGKTKIDSQFVKSAIHDGHAWGLKWKYPGLFDVGENVDLDVVIETTNLLNMWSCIESSYDHLSDGDKARISEVSKFDGFGNNSNHASVASFLVHKLDRFNEFKDRKMYEYTPCSLQQHRAMLATFTRILSSTTGLLSANQITEILDAKSSA